jgi:hypothetical protein
VGQEQEAEPIPTPRIDLLKGLAAEGKEEFPSEDLFARGTK